MGQKEIVKQIVEQAGSIGIRTEVIKRLAMLKGVSCPDRYCRYYQKAGKMRSKYAKDTDKTKTWWICEPEPKETYTESVLRHHREQKEHCVQKAKEFAESPQSSMFNTGYLKGSLSRRKHKKG